LSRKGAKQRRKEKAKHATEKRHIAENNQQKHLGVSSRENLREDSSEVRHSESREASGRSRVEHCTQIIKKMNPQLVLTVVAIILAAVSYVWPHTLAASVILLAAVILMGVIKV